MARQRPVVVPLSFAQQRLWVLEQLHGPSPVYNMPTVYRISGGVGCRLRLGAALADVVGRHESLRTVFAAVDGVPRQVVVGCRRCRFRVAGRLMPLVGRRSRLEQAVGAVVRHGFDLAVEIPVAGNAFPGRRG